VYGGLGFNGLGGFQLGADSGIDQSGALGLSQSADFSTASTLGAVALSVDAALRETEPAPPTERAT